MIFDTIEIMNRLVGILLSLAVGIVLCVISLYALNGSGMKPQDTARGDNT